MLATSRTLVRDHREVGAVLVTSLAFLTSVLAVAWAVV
ncbi:hypothetical protein MPOCJGCO_3040 [Methylobacterium trifolii]|uniref:Uncharacterized protein n=1 Tax=Methylobacterium trifolii TaxID=1003092 RepID=A0ABQ4U2E2_9HYPH|nr:hypothetical protein MPOCJGCO_3040 [Methylobacterium trifolii]